MEEIIEKNKEWKILVWKDAVKKAESTIGWRNLTDKEKYQLVVEIYWGLVTVQQNKGE